MENWMNFTRLATIIALLITCSLGLAAQQVTGETQFAAVLPDFQGRIMQYSFPVNPFPPDWLPAGHVTKFNFSGTNVIEVETVKGVTELYLSDSHDLCGPKAGPVGSCSYLGTMVGALEIKTISLASGATYAHVTGTFLGLFTDDHGDQFANTLGLLAFDTYPSVNSVVVPSAGSVVIVLENN
jgi:hypothetical protein